MPKIVETIPSSLAAEAEAARAWFAAARGSEFKVTGIVDPDEVGEPDRESGHEIQLILCGSVDGQDVCLRERFRVAASNGGYSVTHLEEKTPALGSRFRGGLARTGFGTGREAVKFN